MDLVYVLPGLMGSELWLDNRKLWPPSLSLSRVANPWALLDPNVTVGSIIYRTLVLGFYDALTTPLEKWGYPLDAFGSKGKCIPWPYHWARDVRDTARVLSKDLARAVAGNDHEIVLLGHSMGGLICAYALECLAEGDLGWRERVRLFVTFGTPFRGAPETLNSALGAEGTSGIAAADCMAMMADDRFPSAYQLLPHASCLSSWADEPPLNPIIPYQNLPNGEALGFNNLRAAASLQKELSMAKKNPATRKFNFCGSDYSTVWAVNAAQDGKSLITALIARAGDGSVPSWSARQNDAVQFAPLGDRHTRTFGNAKLLATLNALLFVSSGTAPGGEDYPALAESVRPETQERPRVELARNMLPDHWRSLHVRVFGPPLGGVIKFAWWRLDGVETLDDVRARFLNSQARIGVQQYSTLDLLADYPVILLLDKPTTAGLYALVAWTGPDWVELSDVNAETLEYLWCFSDQNEPEAGPGAGED